MIKILTREYLETYAYLESEIKRIQRRLKYYEAHPAQAAYGVVKGSMQQFPFTECHFVVSGPTIKSTEQRNKAVRQLEAFLESIPPDDVEMKHILALKYVERKTDEEIGNELGFSRRAIGDKIDRFLKKQGEKVEAV